MKRSAVLILSAASGAALMLVAAAGQSPLRTQPQFCATSWFAGLIALAACVVMLSEYYLHSRRIHLYLATGFLASGVMDIWNSAALRAANGSPTDAGYGIWVAGRITLLLFALIGILGNYQSPRTRRLTEGASFTVGAVLWAALIIFLSSRFQFGQWLTDGSTNAIVSVSCALLFGIGCFGYSKLTVNRANAVLGWMTYGLLLAAFGQLALGFQARPEGLLFAFADSMKTLGYLAPLVGLLAEHRRVQSRLQRQASELNGLIQAQQAAGSGSDPADAFRRIVNAVHSSFPSKGVCLLPYSRSRNYLDVAAHAGLEDKLAKDLVLRPSEGVFGTALSERTTVYVPDIREDPGLGEKLSGADGIRSAVCIPLICRGEAAGILAVLFERRERMPKDQLRVLEAFAAQASLTLENAEMRGYVKESAITSDERARDLETVWEIGQAVASKLELPNLVDTLVEKLKNGMNAHACSVVLYELDSGKLQVMGHTKLTRHHEVDDHVDQCDRIAVSVAREGRSRVLSNVPNSPLCKYPELAAGEGGKHHMVSVPMSCRTDLLGAINLFRTGDEPFSNRERQLLEMLAGIVAVGISNTYLYERQHMIAKRLQEVFVPSSFERVPPGTDITSCYAAAGRAEADVGGDFYDIMDLGNGLYGITIGDVSGKGLEAGVYTGMARYMIQAYSAEDPNPESVVTRVNIAMCRYTPMTRFVTLFYGVLDVNAWSFRYTNAGHEMPFYRKADGEMSFLSPTGPAVGAILDAEYTSNVIHLGDGDAVVMFTDGATDVRHEGKWLGPEGLERIVAADLRADIGNPAEAIFRDINDFAKGFLRDDVAILVLRVALPPSGRLF